MIFLMNENRITYFEHGWLLRIHIIANLEKEEFNPLFIILIPILIRIKSQFNSNSPESSSTQLFTLIFIQM